ncbi:MAG: 50S ribosomal protein L10 [Candidatus Eremiobacteraeota bacterium]|nr:50S ribosomal protein L10 [Candidatus Eremiobacteraeota bacterium]MBC5826917.1 50S ribosomal protein L10 [Candidatus Eremiobacteraeota bacterium]
MPTEKKDAAIEALRRQIEGHPNVFFTDFRGLSVGELRTLRSSLRKESAAYAIVKNTLFGIAAGEERLHLLKSVLEGPTGVAFVGADPVGAAKALVQFAADSKKLRVKAALVDGEFFDTAKVEALSKVPPRQELLARLVGSLQSPMYGVVAVLGGNLRKLAQLLDAIREKKKGPEVSPEPEPAAA